MSCKCNKNTCVECKGGDSEYLLVKATSSSAGCDPIDSDTGIDSCTKKEPTFDVAVSGFVVPLPGETVNFTVCNPGIYNVGQWLYFINQEAHLRITSIANKVITLSSTCSGGEEIQGYVYSSSVVVAGSQFIVVGKPKCSSEESKDEDLSESLEGATQLCMPNMEETDPSSTIQVIGRVEADPQNINYRRCIRRIRDFLWKDGCPIWPSIKTIFSGESVAYTRLGINKTTGEVRKYTAEVENSVAGEGYVETYYENNIKFIGPAHIPRIVDPIQLMAVGSYLSRVSVPEDNSYNFNFGLASSLINQMKRKANDLWAEIEIEIFATREVGDNSAIRNWLFKLDGIYIAGFYSNSRNSLNTTIRKIIKINELDQAHEIESLLQSNNPGYYLHLSVRLVKLYV